MPECLKMTKYSLMRYQKVPLWMSLAFRTRLIKDVLHHWSYGLCCMKNPKFPLFLADERIGFSGTNKFIDVSDDKSVV